MKAFECISRCTRSVARCIFPQLKAQSIEELIEIAVLLPDLKRWHHLVRVAYLTFIYFVILLNSLGLKCTRPYLLERNASTGSIGRFLYICGGILISEVIYTRCWLMYMKCTGRLRFRSLVQQCPHSTLKLCVQWCKCLMVITNMFIGMIYLPLLVVQMVNEATAGGQLLMFLWFLSTGYLYRINITDMWILYSIAITGFFTVRGKMRKLKSTLSVLCSGKRRIVLEVAYLRRSLDALDDVIQSLKHLNPLVNCLMITQNVILAPVAAFWVYLFSVDESDRLLSSIQAIALFGSIAYITRGYIVIAFLSIIHSESMKIRTELTSAIVRSNISLFSKRMLNRIVSCIDSGNNILAARSALHVISRIDIFTSFAITLELAILLFSFETSFRVTIV